MPQLNPSYFIMERTGVPDILPPYGQGGKTWTDISQAQRLRLNLVGDKDGTTLGDVTVNVATGFTGSILIAQFVGVQAIRPRNLTNGVIPRCVASAFQSVSTVNAASTGSAWITSGTGAAKVADLVSTYAGTTLITTTPTNRFFVDGNLNMTAMREPGYVCVEVGVQITASTTVGTVTVKLGSSGTAVVAANTSVSNDVGMPFIYLNPDVMVQDNNNVQRLRAENTMSANMGW